MTYLQHIYRSILRRSFFKGQFRIFNYLFLRGFLRSKNSEIVRPINGNFKIKCSTNTWIGAQIVYLGDYERHIKRAFQEHISSGNTVLDVGANIGFHTIYFANLVGNMGKVIAFEPIQSTFTQLSENVVLNDLHNVDIRKIALGNESKELHIYVDENSKNPGANNLFVKGDTKIDCKRGDDVVGNLNVDFIKIDVEGYELLALQGLAGIIENQKPKIIFEYDKDYQLKNNDDVTSIFNFLSQFNYSYFEINRSNTRKIDNVSALNSTYVLALPN